MTNENTAAHTEAEHNDRYGTIVTGGDEIVIYDREHPKAWIQSDQVVAIDA